jgi:hypothetical protein
VNADRQFDLNLVKKVFLSAMAGLARQRASQLRRLEALERLRGTLLETLSSAQYASGPVETMRLRSIIAAGFEAAVLEAEKQRLFLPVAAVASPYPAVPAMSH